MGFVILESLDEDLIDFRVLSDILEGLWVFEQLLAIENMAFENNRLKCLEAPSTLNLCCLLVSILDSPEDLIALLCVLKLLLNTLQFVRKSFFGNQRFIPLGQALDSLLCGNQLLMHLDVLFLLLCNLLLQISLFSLYLLHLFQSLIGLTLADLLLPGSQLFVLLFEVLNLVEQLLDLLGFDSAGVSFLIQSLLQHVDFSFLKLYFLLEERTIFLGVTARFHLVVQNSLYFRIFFTQF